MSPLRPSALALALALALPHLGAAHAAKNVCGDDRARAGEDCDGTDLKGETCPTLGYAGGTLLCATDCTFDVSACETGDTGTPGTSACGDGVVEGYEECESTDDAACPDACSDHCACPATGSGDLEVHVIDVGQGDGILIISPDGYAMLVDSGTNSQAATVAAYMDSIGLSSLDYVMVTHMDADHVGGMDGILDTYPEVVVAFDNGSDPGTIQFSEYDAAAGTRRQLLATGDLIDLGASVTVEAVHTHAGTSVENNNSNVVKITYGTNTFLVGGDCEATCEASYDPGPTQVYKVHHHGSDDSSSAAFLESMGPETALISVGEGNPYGHPGAETLARLATVGATVYRTDLDGDLAVVSDGSAYTVNGSATCSDGATQSCGTTDVGACSYGTQTCTGGAWDTCSGAVEPTTEDCSNGIDDDCDGAVDAADSNCSATSTQLQIVQVAYDTPGTDSIEEFVDLYNPTGAAVSLDGWSLSDGAASWSLPAGTSIASGGFLSVSRDQAGFEALYGLSPDVEGMTLALNNDGDVVVLTDDAGAEVDRVAWESYTAGWTVTAGTGDSIVRVDVDVDTDDPSDWTTLSPADPYGGSATEPDSCGNGTCDTGEDCTTCAADCDGVTGGKPTNRYCCGNGTCEPAGEDASTCPIDC